MGPSELPRLWPEETSVSSVYESCADMLPKHCRNGHGQAFQSKMENRYPWDAPAGQAGKRRDSSEHSGS